jgi:hypothetical protein
VLNIKHVTISTLLWAAASGCTEAPLTSDEIGQNLQELCANGDGVNSALAALAVSTAKELKRWQSSSDFTVTNNWVYLTSTGKAQCSDGKCWNTQAILDLQKAPLGTVKFGSVTFNADNFRSHLIAELNEQRVCEARGPAVCPSEAHKLTFKSQQPGACDTVFTFDATSPTGAPLRSPQLLDNKVIFAGYPENPYLAFSAVGSTVSIDPTYGLNEGGTTTAGSCSAACTKLSSTDITGSCCDCAGAVARQYQKSPFSTAIFLCR